MLGGLDGVWGSLGAASPSASCEALIRLELPRRRHARARAGDGDPRSACCSAAASLGLPARARQGSSAGRSPPPSGPSPPTSPRPLGARRGGRARRASRSSRWWHPSVDQPSLEVTLSTIVHHRPHRASRSSCSPATPATSRSGQLRLRGAVGPPSADGSPSRATRSSSSVIGGRSRHAPRRRRRPFHFAPARPVPLGRHAGLHARHQQLAPLPGLAGALCRPPPAASPAARRGREVPGRRLQPGGPLLLVLPVACFASSAGWSTGLRRPARVGRCSPSGTTSLGRQPLALPVAGEARRVRPVRGDRLARRVPLRRPAHQLLEQPGITFGPTCR